MRIAIALVLVLSFGVSIFAVTSTASAQTAPEVSANFAHCNRSIIEADDLFCQLVYELPQSISDGVSDAWCAELFTQTGCDSTPANPTDPTSLPTGLANISLYDNCGADCLTASLLGVSEAPRIWHGLGGIYIEEAGSITWADPDINICIESVQGSYTNREQACITPFWSIDENTIPAQRLDMGRNLVTNLTSLQSNRNQANNTYVTQGRITASGTTFAKEAFEFANIVAPTAFLTSISTLNSDITAPDPSQLQADIEATATAIRGSYEQIGSLITPTGGPELGGLIIFGALGLISFIIIYSVTKEFMWPSIAFAAWGLFGTVAGGIDSQVIFIYILLISLPAMVFLYRKIGFANS